MTEFGKFSYLKESSDVDRVSTKRLIAAFLRRVRDAAFPYPEEATERGIEEYEMPVPFKSTMVKLMGSYPTKLPMVRGRHIHKMMQCVGVFSVLLVIAGVFSLVFSLSPTSNSPSDVTPTRDGIRTTSQQGPAPANLNGSDLGPLPASKGGPAIWVPMVEAGMTESDQLLMNTVIEDDMISKADHEQIQGVAVDLSLAYLNGDGIESYENLTKGPLGDAPVGDGYQILAVGVWREPGDVSEEPDSLVDTSTELKAFDARAFVVARRGSSAPVYFGVGMVFDGSWVANKMLSPGNLTAKP